MVELLYRNGLLRMTTQTGLSTAFAKRWNGLKVRIDEALTPRSASSAKRWLRTPSLKQGGEVCLFVSYAPNGEFSDHSLFHAKAWADEGYQVVLIAVVNDLACINADDLDHLEFAAGVLVRENAGHDFGAWSAAIMDLLPQLQDTAVLGVVNDSLYGPLAGFAELIERVRTLDADVIGAVESVEWLRHFQSYMLFFKPKAIQSRAFSRFWGNVRNVPKGIVIRRYELRLRLRMDRAGLRCAALFPYRPGDPINPSLFGWRTLLARGFPFVKVTTIRADPGGERIEGWPEIMAAHGYDPRLVYRHLETI